MSRRLSLAALTVLLAACAPQADDAPLADHEAGADRQLAPGGARLLPDGVVDPAFLDDRLASPGDGEQASACEQLPALHEVAQDACERAWQAAIDADEAAGLHPGAPYGDAVSDWVGSACEQLERSMLAAAAASVGDGALLAGYQQGLAVAAEDLSDGAALAADRLQDGDGAAAPALEAIAAARLDRDLAALAGAACAAELAERS